MSKFSKSKDMKILSFVIDFVGLCLALALLSIKYHLISLVSPEPDMKMMGWNANVWANEITSESLIDQSYQR